jgi:branched-chain amino acid transport system ATP-binding protein
MIETRRLAVSYFGRVLAVKDLSLTVDDGEVVALIGPNGAGKTSSLRAIAGLFGREDAAISGGEVLINGQRVNGKPPYAVADLGLVMIPERDKVFLELTPLEHFRLACAGGREQMDEDLRRVLELFPPLESHLRRPAGYLSGGQRQMLAFGTALFRRPRAILVDEFSQGLAPLLVQSLAGSLRTINATGMAVLMVEQNAALAMSIAHRVYILDGGRMVAAGAPQELAHSSSLVGAYLGTAPHVPTGRSL